jgi:iron complex transport system substrate-binding protein
MRPILTTAALLALGLAQPALAQEWRYDLPTGEAIELATTPERIVAHADAAAALIALGIRPVGIFADSPVSDSKPLQGLDLEGIAIVGTAWGEIDIEAVAALQPDLIVAEYWPLEDSWSGGEITGEESPLRALAPIAGPEQGDSIVTLIEDYEVLAESLGADLDGPAIADERTRFEASRDAFTAALAQKPDLTAMAIWAGTDALYVAEPAGAAELLDFVRWGLDLVDPEIAEDRGYWHVLSWEEADTYQPDLVLVDNRSEATLVTAEAQPTWTAIDAVAAGAVAEWPAYWLRTYAAYADALDDLTAAIEAADPDIGG